MASLLSLVSAAAMLPLAMGAAILPRGTEIVGGTQAGAGEFPYIVSLQENGFGHICGGVLVNARTVVTAGHCTVNSTATNVKVRAGTNTWNSGGTLVSVSSLVLHPGYKEDSQGVPDNDVGVWHLSSSIPTSSTVAYAKLTASGSDPAAGSTVTTAGWGTTSENSQSIPARLNKVSVPVIARATCNTDYSGEITTNMFCAGLTQGGKDSCSGDSGGPIVDASGTVVGVVSWGQGCAEAGFPGVYTRLGNYISFINSNLA
ncbi:Trypsin [Cladobotryum mycophilum]|uniref:Trypsin n=1 Tax=Cladobotryum mycophilum TaxID=491253 RepID=A0ABR0SPH9_9HYPO